MPTFFDGPFFDPDLDDVSPFWFFILFFTTPSLLGHWAFVSFQLLTVLASFFFLRLGHHRVVLVNNTYQITRHFQTIQTRNISPYLSPSRQLIIGKSKEVRTFSAPSPRQLICSKKSNFFTVSVRSVNNILTLIPPPPALVFTFSCLLTPFMLVCCPTVEFLAPIVLV